MTYVSVFFSIFAAFLVSTLLCPVMIYVLKFFNVNQQIRADGPRGHLKKAGVPTMGGLVILISAVIINIFEISMNRQMSLLLFAFLGFGAIGFLDDYIKVVLKRSLGLTVIQKLVLQGVVALLFCYYYMVRISDECEMLVPFTGGIRDGIYLTMPKWLFFIFIYIIMIGTVNGVNLTDGLDGLASSVTLLIVVFFSIAELKTGSILVFSGGCVAGALMGFLLFNVYPALVFMGDTGSLALGGFVAAMAVELKMPLYIAIVGIIYLAEVLSVILQVVYFKLSGGKRLFRMAPLHHHFEQCGWRETTVVALFSIVTTVMCIAAILD